jgi:hypothetical protein
MTSENRRNTLLRQMSVFWARRNNIVTVTTPTCFLLRQSGKHRQRNGFCILGLVTQSPTTERLLSLLRGSLVTVTFPRGTAVTNVIAQPALRCVYPLIQRSRLIMFSSSLPRLPEFVKHQLKPAPRLIVDAALRLARLQALVGACGSAAGSNASLKSKKRQQSSSFPLVLMPICSFGNPKFGA